MGSRKILNVSCCCFRTKDKTSVPYEELKNPKSDIDKKNTYVIKEESGVNKEKKDVPKEETDVDKEKTYIDKGKNYIDKDKNDIVKKKIRFDKDETDLNKEKTDVDIEKTYVDKEETGINKKETGFNKEKTDGIIGQILTKFKDNDDERLKVLIDELISFLKNINGTDILQNVEITIYNRCDSYKFCTGHSRRVILANYENDNPRVIKFEF